MPEGNGDDTGAPESLELEHGDLMDNNCQTGEDVLDITVDQGMVAECRHGDLMDNSCRSEEGACSIAVELRMKLECDYMESSGATGEEACDITIDQGEMEAHIGDGMDSNGLVQESTDSVKKEGEDMRNNGDTPEVMVGKASLPSENSSTVCYVRKKPVAVIVGANHKFNVRSRYLSSPVGSCHDSCKFGHRYESDKRTSPTSGMTRGTRSLMRMNTIDVSKSATKEEPKKKTCLRRLSLPGSIEEKDEKLTPEVMNRSKKDLNQSMFKRIQSEIKPSSVPTPGQTSRSKTENQLRNKVVVRNLNLLESSSLVIKAIRTKKESGSHSKSEKEKGKVSSPFSPTLLKKSPSMKARLYKNPKSVSRSSNLSKSKEANTDGSGDVPEKTLYMIELHSSEKKPAKRASKSALSNDSSPNTLRRSRVSKSKDSKRSQKRDNIDHPSSTTDLSTSATHVVEERSQFLGEGQPELGSINVEQIGTISEIGGSISNAPRRKSMVEGGMSKPSTARAKSNVERSESKPSTPRAKSTVGDGGSKPNTPRGKSRGDGGSGTPGAKSKGDGGFKPSTPRAKSKGDGGSKPSTPRAKSTLERKTKATGKLSYPEEKDGSSWKVKFKKGTVVALQGANSAPKKLLFKRGRMLGEEQIAKNEVVRIVKNRGRRASDPHDSKQPESGKVRLRHQETSSKKDTIDLNDVIEETASQLVKTRKSKVKALVGAFETVMSLRDRKPIVEASAS